LIKCFYHSSDLDGKCSAAIVRLKYPDCELFPIDYNDPFPWEDITATDTIVMVDFSLAASDMKYLAEKCKLVWIDHHATALDAAKVIGFEPEGLRKVGDAACELVWDYYFDSHYHPTAVIFLGRYDVWDHSNADVVPFQMGARMYALEPDDSMWKVLLVPPSMNPKETQDLVLKILGEGKIILEYEKQQNADLCRKHAFEVDWGGLKMIAVNSAKGSAVLDSVVKPEHDLTCTFSTNSVVWWVSLYSGKPDVHCGEIAKMFGGGGHKGAAGFTCNELPWLKANPKRDTLSEINELLGIL